MHAHVIRIAVDPLGQPISGLVECQGPRCRRERSPIDVGPFDTVGDVLQFLLEGLDVHPRLWDNRP